MISPTFPGLAEPGAESFGFGLRPCPNCFEGVAVGVHESHLEVSAKPLQTRPDHNHRKLLTPDQWKQDAVTIQRRKVIGPADGPSVDQDLWRG